MDKVIQLEAEVKEISVQSKKVIAFRVTTIKDAGSSAEEKFTRSPGSRLLVLRLVKLDQFLLKSISFKLFGKKFDIILELDIIKLLENLLRQQTEFIRFTLRLDLMDLTMHDSTLL